MGGSGTFLLPDCAPDFRSGRGGMDPITLPCLGMGPGQASRGLGAQRVKAEPEP